MNVQATDTPCLRDQTVHDVWYCANQNGYAGPLTLQELLEKLVTLPNAADALVWCQTFSDWKRAGDVGELRAHVLVPPPLPHSRGAPGTSDRNKVAFRWNFQWWWIIVALPIVALLSVKVAVGSNVGRGEMDRLSDERRAMRKANKISGGPLINDK